MKERRKKIRKLTYSGLLVALITLLTVALRVVVPPFGVYHVGDGVVLLCGMLLGPYGVFPAAMGAALSDLLGGFPNYVFYRAAIKGGMALIAGQFLRVEEKISRHNVLVLVMSGLWMVLGYLGADALIYSSLKVALSLIMGNVAQAAIAVVLGCLMLSIQRLFPKDLRD